MASQATLAVAIFVLTVALVLRPPRGFTPARAAGLGAALSLLAGTVSWRDTLAVAALTWDATLTLVAIFLISRLLDEAGFFQWAALVAARRAGGAGGGAGGGGAGGAGGGAGGEENGGGRRLLAGIVLLGAAVSALFTNDATVLILTPIIYELLGALGLERRRRLPYLMALGFVADAMSLPFPMSNLTNIIIADHFHLGFGRFALLMLPPSLATLAASLVVLPAVCRSGPGGLDGPSRAGALPPPASAIRDPLLFRAGAAVLVLMLAALMGGSLLRVPVAAVALAAAAVLLAVYHARRLGSTAAMVRRAPWPVIAFAMAMYVVVFGLHNAGFTARLAAFLADASGRGTTGAVLGAGSASALLSAAANNLPAAMLTSLALDRLPPGPLREGMVLASVVGVDIGPKLTPIGSLATLIWLDGLRVMDLPVSGREYLRFSLRATPPVLAAALAGLVAGLLLAGG